MWNFVAHKATFSWLVISLHIRSMWETICDAWACWSGWNFGPNSGRIPPILKYSFRIPPQMKIVTESKSESFRIPPPQWKLSQSPNPRVSEYLPSPKWKLSEIPNLRVSEYPLQNENCHRVQIWEFQNTPSQNENCHRVQIREFQITPPNENCHRVQIREFQNNPPNWKNFRFQTSE